MTTAIRSNEEAWRMVLANAGLPYRIVQRFFFGEREALLPRFGTIEDALQIARLGMHRAALTWEEGRDSAYVTYAWVNAVRAMWKVTKRLNKVTASIDTADEKSRTWSRNLTDPRLPDPAVVVAEQDYRTTRLQQVKAVLDNQPAKRREAFLAAAAGQSMADIGRERGVSREAIRQQVERVVAEVRGMVDE